MNIATVLFDLDGTITDSAEGILRSVRYALKKQNKKIPSKVQLTSFIGPPLAESFQTICQLGPAEVEQAILDYREYYQKTGIFDNRVYPKIPQVLAALQQRGLSLYIATSKPEVFAKQILEHFNLATYFNGIYGASLDGKRSKKPEVITYTLEQANIHCTKATVMIGDRSHDIIGAKENGLKSIGVLYGFGTKEELQTAGADGLVCSPVDLLTQID